MPKLRNAGTDIGTFTQWLGRKCRNHNPLLELGMTDRKKAADRYKTNVTGDLGVVREKEGLLVYKAAGRAFTIEVKEVPYDMYEGIQLEKVGY